MMSSVATNYCPCCCDIHLSFVPPVEHSVRDDIVMTFSLSLDSWEDLERGQPADAEVRLLHLRELLWHQEWGCLLRGNQPQGWAET